MIGAVEVYWTVMRAPVLKLVDAAPKLTVEEAVRVVKKALELAAQFEARGLSWRPHVDDFFIDDAKELVIAETQGLSPLAYPSRFEIAPLLAALGNGLIPMPLALGPPSLVRLLLPYARPIDKTPRSIADARRLVDAIDLQTPTTPAENAALTDIGLCRDHNDDVALVVGGSRTSWHALVVCDGVSSVAYSAGAAAVAARTARDEITRGAATAMDARSIVTQASHAADLAVRKLASELSLELRTKVALGTTIVMALVRGDELAVAWVGDSRAYWVTERGEEQLTSDHSENKQLTSCLGMVDVDGRSAHVKPDVVTRTLGKKGALVLCSDGLWNHFPTTSAIARLVNHVQSTNKNSAILARFLVNSALAAGGSDNVSVAVHVRGA